MKSIPDVQLYLRFHKDTLQKKIAKGRGLKFSAKASKHDLTEILAEDDRKILENNRGLKLKKFVRK